MKHISEADTQLSGVRSWTYRGQHSEAAATDDNGTEGQKLLYNGYKYGYMDTTMNVINETFQYTYG